MGSAFLALYRTSWTAVGDRMPGPPLPALFEAHVWRLGCAKKRSPGRERFFVSLYRSQRTSVLVLEEMTSPGLGASLASDQAFSRVTQSRMGSSSLQIS